jgi:hypothetical protein
VETTSASLASQGDSGGADGNSDSQSVQGGSLIRITLRPGANSKQVAEQVEVILSEEVRERAVAAVRGQAAIDALQQREWLDTSQLTEIAASESGTSWLLMLLLAVVIAALGLLAWRYVRHRRAVAAMS